MTQITNFGFLGNDFQLKVLSQIMCDRTFGINIIEIINPQYFDNKHYRKIATIIKNYNDKFDNSLPTMTGLKEQILLDVKDELDREYLINVVKELEKKSLEDDLATKQTALNFCKQQELKKALGQVNDIIEKGDFERYDDIEEKIRKALAVVDRKDDSIEVLDDIDSVLEDDYRKPIPTGIDGLDDKIGGGVGKGELAVFIAPTGVGKSTFLTKVANTAYNYGYNVLQIFFEDSKKDIQRKHLTCWSGIGLGDLSKAKDFVKEKAISFKKNGGKIILKKCPSDSTTVGHIKQYLRYLRNKGIVIDMLVLDYIDCISATKTSEDQNTNEGTVIRQIEGLISEFNMAGWVAAQSNRGGITADIVGIESIQGSIKRAQVGHLVISAGKTLPQKEMGLATMAILKSRFGGDGIVFKDMTFKNETMEFDTTENSIVSQFGFENDREQKQEEQKKQKTIDALESFRREKNRIMNAPSV